MLKESILKTISYFDVQDHPLTLLEIYKYLIHGNQAAEAYNLEQILLEVQALQQNEIQEKHGFYFLQGRAAIADNRLHNNFYATPRLKRAKRILRMVRFVPFISAVALTGSEALNNSKEGSDIDLLIFTQKGRMWLGRLFISAFFQMLGMRRHGKNIANRFCLNHYIEQGKVLNKDQNLYTAIEYVSLIPYYGAELIYDFQQRNIGWIKNILQQPQIAEYSTPKAAWTKISFEKLLANPVGDYLERLVGKVQLAKIRIQEYIIVEADELSFHPGSKGQQILRKVPFQL